MYFPHGVTQASFNNSGEPLDNYIIWVRNKSDETYYNIAVPQIIIYLYNLYACTLYLHGATIRAVLRIQ